MVEVETRFVNFRYEVPVLTGVLLSEPSPLTGQIESITFHFPSGCNALVFVRFLLNHEPVWPLRGQYIALDDATPVYAVSEAVKKGDPLEVEIQNGDEDYAHTISVILSMKGILAEVGKDAKSS